MNGVLCLKLSEIMILSDDKILKSIWSFLFYDDSIACVLSLSNEFSCFQSVINNVNGCGYFSKVWNIWKIGVLLRIFDGHWKIQILFQSIYFCIAKVAKLHFDCLLTLCLFSFTCCHFKKKWRNRRWSLRTSWQYWMQWCVVEWLSVSKDSSWRRYLIWVHSITHWSTSICPSTS